MRISCVDAILYKSVQDIRLGHILVGQDMGQLGRMAWDD